MSEYQLLDSGDGEKLEQFGPYILQRPCAVAFWKKQNKDLWKKADAIFSREEGKGWSFKSKLPRSWHINYYGITYHLELTNFGHLGIFPEHAPLMKSMPKKEGMKVLNLFAYTGGASILFALEKNAKVCHVDASKKSVSWARKNAESTPEFQSNIRWIVDDAEKFMQRELRRGERYDAIVMDPPTFGRGPQHEAFFIEKSIHTLLDLSKQLLTDSPLFVAFTCHTPGFTPIVMKQLMGYYFSGNIESGEMVLEQKENFFVPSGSFAVWKS